MCQWVSGCRCSRQLWWLWQRVAEAGLLWVCCPVRACWAVWGAGVLCLLQQCQSVGALLGVGGCCCCVSMGECLCADGNAMKSPQCLCQGCCEGLSHGSSWGGWRRQVAGRQLAALAGTSISFGAAYELQGRYCGVPQGQQDPVHSSASLPPAPGPRPVPSPAGSSGQHHGRHPGSPSAPGRGLLDSQAPGRLTQRLLRLRVQAPCPAGAGGPGP